MLFNIINLVVGLFFIIGAFIAYKFNNKNLINFSIGMAFSVLIMLLFLDILPETLELLPNYQYLYLLAGAFIGIGILFLIEKVVPHHDHFEEKAHHQHKRHLTHIGIMTSVTLIIHNLVEGMSIYGVASASLKTGLIYAFGVGLHNIPFGIEITAMLNQEKKNRKNIFILLLSLSTFAGGLIIHLFKNYLSNLFLGVLLSITVGMIIYLLFMELLVELKENYNKYSSYGIILGFILIIIGVLL